MTRVEIQSGMDAVLPESLSGTFQVRDREESREWCVAPAPLPPAEKGAALGAASEARRR